MIKVPVILMIGLLVGSILTNFYQVDKPRKPITFRDATISAFINTMLIWLLWRVYL